MLDEFEEELEDHGFYPLRGKKKKKKKLQDLSQLPSYEILRKADALR